MSHSERSRSFKLKKIMSFQRDIELMSDGIESFTCTDEAAVEPAQREPLELIADENTDPGPAGGADSPENGESLRLLSYKYELRKARCTKAIADELALGGYLLPLTLSAEKYVELRGVTERNYEYAVDFETGTSQISPNLLTAVASMSIGDFRGEPASAFRRNPKFPEFLSRMLKRLD